MNLPKGYTKDDVKALVLEEKQASYLAIKSKRELFLDRYALYNNISDTNNKIYVRLIRSTIQTLLGLYYTDEISVSFNGRQLWDDDVVETYENLAKFDQEEMELAKVNYDAQWNRLFYWVGIRIFDRWDKFRECPIYRSIDPLSWYPDPSWYIDNHRFHWFDLEVCDSDLTDDIYSSLAELKSQKAEELERTDRRRKEYRELQIEVENELNPRYSVYHHYTTINGEKYVITLGNGGDLLIRCEKVETVYKEEKDNLMETPFPIILNFYEPLKWDPFGVCIPDLLEDKQKAEQLFLNLNRIKAENEALWDVFMVDTNAIKNINQLKSPKAWIGAKYVKADLNINPNPVKEIEKANVKQDAYNMPEIIRGQASEDVWMDARTLWVSTGGNVTATENQRIQKNANIKLILNNKINQWGEKDFWRDWMRRYYEYFSMKSEKNIKLNNSFGSTILTVKRKDLMTGYDLDIQIINKSQEEEVNQKKIAALLSLWELVLSDPTSPKISKLFYKRTLARLQGMSREERNVLFYDPIEEEGRMHIALINENESVKELIEPEQDLPSLLLMYHRAMDTKAKREAISTVQQLIATKPKQQEMPQSDWMWWVSRMAMNSMMQQEQEQWASSLADVKTQ